MKALGIGARIDLRDVEVSHADDSWSVRLRGEAKRRAELIGAGTPTVEVERMDDASAKRLVPRVLLPLNTQDSAQEGDGFSAFSREARF